MMPTIASPSLTYPTRAVRPWFARIPIGIFYREFMSIRTMRFFSSCAARTLPGIRSHFFSIIKFGQLYRTQPGSQQIHNRRGILPASHPNTVRLPWWFRMNPRTHSTYTNNCREASQRFNICHSNLGHNRTLADGGNASLPVKQASGPC